MPEIAYGTPAGRWVIAASVLGSGLVFLDSTVVNVALPAISNELGGGIAGLQWVLDAYLLMLGALIIFGGSLGDILGRRRVFVWGLLAFTVASVICGLAPNLESLIGARALQGAAGALLVPASLALVSSYFRSQDRGRAIGAWSGLSGVSTAAGPFLGGYLVDAVSWRLVFLINLPAALITLWIAVRHVPESPRDPFAVPDWSGAVLAALALGGAVFALIEGPVRGFSSNAILAAILVAGAAAVLFVLRERHTKSPMVPGSIFLSRQFSGANATTFAVYASLGGAMFLFVVQLQQSLGYSALEAGAALFPITLILVVLSPRMGRVSARLGPRWPMTFGPLIVAAGLTLFTRSVPGSSYATAVLPAVIVFGLGLAITVAPLTSAVLAAADPGHQGLASGINNAVARLAGLAAVAVLPFASGLTGGDASLTEGFRTAMLICAVTCLAGGLVAALTIRESAPLRCLFSPPAFHSCAPAEAREAGPTGASGTPREGSEEK